MPSATDAVRDVAAQIPAGGVMSYGEIAAATGLNPRYVGRIVSQISADIPWWRVVRADGTPPTCHGGCAAEILRKENVPFAGQKIDWQALAARAPLP